MIIDRFEGDFALVELEDKSLMEIPLIYIPKEAREGDFLRLVVDKTTSRRRRDEIDNLMDELWD